MEKFSKYLPWIIGAAIILGLLWISKMIKLQTSILIGVAGKLGVTPDDSTPSTRHNEQESSNDNESAHEETEEEAEKILDLAEKIWDGKNLTKKEKEFLEKFKTQVSEEVEVLCQEDLQTISNAITNKEELTQDDVDWYKAHFDKYQKSLNLVPLTDEVKIKAEEFKNEEVLQPETEEDRKHILLSFLDDGIPKNGSLLAVMYAKKTGLAVSTGNTSKLLDRLLAEGKLKNQKILHNSRNKVFYGLPAWFDNKKFHKDYIKKILEQK